MNYVDTLKARGMQRLAKKAHNITCLRELDKFLKSLGIVDTARIITIKEVFDVNLPDDYNNIVGSGGTCGYWGIVYKKLFDLLGYNCSLIEVRSEGNSFHHVITRVRTKSISVDFSRTCMGLGDADNTEYSYYWYTRIRKEFKNVELVFYDTLDNFYERFSLYSAVNINRNILQVLSDYVVCISDSDISLFSPPALTSLCEDDLTYRVMCGFANEVECRAVAQRLYNAHVNIRS